MERPFLQALSFYRGKSALQISPSPELALIFVSMAPAIPGMENKMPDKNTKKYLWDKSSPPASTLKEPWRSLPQRQLSLRGEKTWFLVLTELSHPGTGTQQRAAAMGAPRLSAFIVQRTNRKDRSCAIFLESPKTTKTNRETRSEFRSNTLISSKSLA